MQMKIFRIAHAVFAALVFVVSAQATIISTFNSSGSMPAAATLLGSDDFNTGPVGLPGNYTTTSVGLTRGSLNYLGFYNESGGIGYDNTYRSPGTSEPDTMGTGGGVMMGGPSNIFGGLNAGFEHGLQISFGSLAGVTYVSFNFSAFRILDPSDALVFSTVANPITLRLAVQSGGVWTAPASMPILTVAAGTTEPSFFGFTTAGDVSGVKIYIDGPAGTHTNRVILDNLVFGTAATGEVQSPAGNGTGDSIPEPSTYLLCAVALFGTALYRRRMS
ncbi:MAG: hypothetical protein ACK5TN_14765 [Acidobacteriota bacterium]|jgi:hypothetical protein